MTMCLHKVQVVQILGMEEHGNWSGNDKLTGADDTRPSWMQRRQRWNRFWCWFVFADEYFIQFLNRICTSGCYLFWLYFICSCFLLPFLILCSRDVQAEAEMEVVADGLFVSFMIFQNLRYCSLLLNIYVLEIFFSYPFVLCWHSLSFTIGLVPSRFWNVGF